MFKRFLIAIALCVFASPVFAFDEFGDTCVDWGGGVDFDRCIDTSAPCALHSQCDSGYCNIEAGGYCSCSGCQQSAEICERDTYWDSSSGACVDCPSWNGISGKSEPGSISILNCYIQSGSYYTGSDAAGSYRYTVSSNCYYQN